MAKRSRRNSKLKALPKAAAVVAFTETEEAFFREGDAETFAVNDDHASDDRQSFWRRLLSSIAA